MITTKEKELNTSAMKAGFLHLVASLDLLKYWQWKKNLE